ncbi:MAG: DUF4386 domain-containing protein [Caulobacterales bacterium]|nr:DUF4386 domain-containing protein [Caulobacterales bacterium]
MTASNPVSARRLAGAAMTVFPLAATVPYVLLIDRFGYDDILREPPLVVLRAFQDGGPALVLIWLAFALCAVSFLWVAGWTAESVRAQGGRWPLWATLAGAGSALVQAIGLLRWPFVVPGLAATALDPAADPAARSAAVVVFGALNQFAGVALGEHLGQTLLAAWTFALAVAVLRGRLAPAPFGWLGLALVPLWILGQSELLATVVPGFLVVEATPIAFMGWQVWLLTLGLWWVVVKPRA